jgi:hypothetical protein
MSHTVDTATLLSFQSQEFRCAADSRVGSDLPGFIGPQPQRLGECYSQTRVVLRKNSSPRRINSLPLQLLTIETTRAYWVHTVPVSDWVGPPPGTAYRPEPPPRLPKGSRRHDAAEQRLAAKHTLCQSENGSPKMRQGSRRNSRNDPGFVRRRS